jgi:hypothetical protein
MFAASPGGLQVHHYSNRSEARYCQASIRQGGLHAALVAYCCCVTKYLLNPLRILFSAIICQGLGPTSTHCLSENPSMITRMPTPPLRHVRRTTVSQTRFSCIARLRRRSVTTGAAWVNHRAHMHQRRYGPSLVRMMKEMGVLRRLGSASVQALMTSTALGMLYYYYYGSSTRSSSDGTCSSRSSHHAAWHCYNSCGAYLHFYLTGYCY